VLERRRYAYPGSPPLVLTHRGCGGGINDRRTCRECGAELEPGDVIAERGPGSRRLVSA
jgi:hypothetical protein